MNVSFRIAKTRAEVLRAQYLIAQVYNEHYEVYFSEDRYDLAAKIEPWPHRYLLATCDGTPVAALGMYVSNTYVERFGGLDHGDIPRTIAEAGAADRYAKARRHEITKVSVHPAWQGRGLSRVLLGLGHSHAFLRAGDDTPYVVLVCAKLSIFRNIYDRAGLRTRTLRPFPVYKVHELYRSPTDPMESRIIVPDIDIPERWYAATLPAEHPIETSGGAR